MSVSFPILDIAYEVTIPDAVRFVGADIDDASELALEEIGIGLVGLYKGEAAAVGAIDTRFFIDTIGVRYATRFERGVGSLAPYSGVIEHGWIYRARGQASYPGRFPAARAVARLDSVIEDAFSRQMRR